MKSLDGFGVAWLLAVVAALSVNISVADMTVLSSDDLADMSGFSCSTALPFDDGVLSVHPIATTPLEAFSRLVMGIDSPRGPAVLAVLCARVTGGSLAAPDIETYAAPGLGSRGAAAIYLPDKDYFRLFEYDLGDDISTVHCVYSRASRYGPCTIDPTSLLTSLRPGQKDVLGFLNGRIVVRAADLRSRWD